MNFDISFISAVRSVLDDITTLSISEYSRTLHSERSEASYDKLVPISTIQQFLLNSLVRRDVLQSDDLTALEMELAGCLARLAMDKSLDDTARRTNVRTVFEMHNKLDSIAHTAVVTGDR